MEDGKRNIAYWLGRLDLLSAGQMYVDCGDASSIAFRCALTQSFIERYFKEESR